MSESSKIESTLTFQRIDAVPIVHGRLAFAMEVRRRLLEHRYEAVAVELPATLQPAFDHALDQLPVATAVVYREVPAFVDSRSCCYFVPVQPCDAIVEACRIARGERIRTHFIDAEVEDFHSSSVVLPDPHALHALGLPDFFGACVPIVASQPSSPQDPIRERHMVARLQQLLQQTRGRILFVCGMKHWLRIREGLTQGSGEIYGAEEGEGRDNVSVVRVHHRSLVIMMGELPFLVDEYERHRCGLELDDFDAVASLKRLLLRAREHHSEQYPGSLERPRPQALRTILNFVRKMTVRRKMLLPDGYTLTVAAKGVVGNDYALSVLELAHSYPPNRDAPLSPYNDVSDIDDTPCETLTCRSENEGTLSEDPVPLQRRTPGSAYSLGRLRLERPPDVLRRQEWERRWQSGMQCSWPPEDLVIENFRDYVGKRALSLARVGVSRSEPFTTSFLDGIDLRESLRDVRQRRLHVREEPRVPGAVGALVLIFEEDDFGVSYPWRTTWMAEHQNESTLAFYATDFMQDIIGPGIGRAFYGGCMMIFPPIWIPDVWDDMRFERAKTPSERLLLGAIYWSKERYVVHVAQRPTSAEVRNEARNRGKHIIHLPLSTFSSTTLERLRRVHVLNDHEVRTWAHRFIR